MIIIIDLLGLAARSWINTMRSNKTTLGLGGDDDDDDEGLSKMEGKTNFSRHLQVVQNSDC